MSNQTIEHRVDGLFELEGEARPQELSAFVHGLITCEDKTENLVRKHLILFVSAWAIFYAISVGFIKESQFLGFKLQDVSVLALAGPSLLGIIAYALFGGMALAFHLRKAICRCYRFYLPAAHEEDLESLLLSPTVLGSERVLQGWHKPAFLNRIADFWLVALAALVTLGTLAALIQLLYLLNIGAAYGPYLIGSTGAVGLIFWCRGIHLLITSTWA